MRQTTVNKITAGAAMVTALAALSVPIVVAYLGNAQNALIAETQLRRDYVQIAVAILTAPPTKENEDLKRWPSSSSTRAPPSRCANVRSRLVTGKHGSSHGQGWSTVHTR